jgi:hypothetical protein
MRGRDADNFRIELSDKGNGSSTTLERVESRRNLRRRGRISELPDEPRDYIRVVARCFPDPDPLFSSQFALAFSVLSSRQCVH